MKNADWRLKGCYFIWYFELLKAKVRNYSHFFYLIPIFFVSLHRKVYICRVNNIYHRDIIEILLECGREGLRIKNIARRIYNRHADFFVTDIDYSEIRNSVGRYLWEQSQRHESPFTHARYGTYAIKPDFAIQLDLFLDNAIRSEFRKEQAKAVPNPHHIQLELF